MKLNGSTSRTASAPRLRDLPAALAAYASTYRAYLKASIDSYETTGDRNDLPWPVIEAHHDADRAVPLWLLPVVYTIERRVQRELGYRQRAGL